MNKLVSRIKSARSGIIAVIDSFPIGREDELLFTEWSLKNMVSHLSGWAEHQIETIKNIKKGIIVDKPKNLKIKINERYVIQRRKKSWPIVYREFKLFSGKLLKEYQTLPEKLWKKPVWGDDPTTPINLIKIETSHYYKTHGLQIKKIIRKQSVGNKNPKNNKKRTD